MEFILRIQLMLFFGGLGAYAIFLSIKDDEDEDLNTFERIGIGFTGVFLITIGISFVFSDLYD